MLEILVRSFPFLDYADETVPVDKVARWPHGVPVPVPDEKIVIHDYRVSDVQLLERVADVERVAAEGKLGSVDPDDHEPLVGVAAMPLLDVGKGSQAILARIIPEIHENCKAPQRTERNRIGIEPERS